MKMTVTYERTPNEIMNRFRSIGELCGRRHILKRFDELISLEKKIGLNNSEKNEYIELLTFLMGEI